MEHFANTRLGIRHSFLCVMRVVAFMIFALTGCTPEDPQQYIEEGKALSEQGDLESARVQFRNALQLDPKLVDGYFRLALIDERLQNWGDMLTNVRAALELDPNHVDATIKLAQIYLLGGLLEEAEKQVQSALKLSPYNPRALLVKASIRYRQQKYEEAFSDIERVLAAEPFMADAIGLQVNVLSAMGRNDEAVSLAKKGVEHNPDDVELRTQKIRIEVDQKQFDAALRDYHTLIEQFPEQAEYRLAIVQIFRDLERSEEAENLIREAIELYPEEILYRYKLIDIVEERDINEAEPLLDELIEKFPNDLGLKFRLADIYVSQQRFTKAEQLLNNIAGNLEENKGYKDLINTKIKLAEVALKQKNLAKVEQLAEEILKLDVDQSDALLLRAGIRLNRLDTDGAISDLRIVLRDRPYLEHAVVLLAKANLVKGESEVAESHLRKILDFNPNSVTALVSLTNELFKRGDLARAEELTLKEVSANPSSSAPIEMLIQLRELRKDWKGVAAALEQLKNVPDTGLTVQYWSAHLASLQGNTESAIKGYQALLEEKSDYALALMELAQLYDMEGRRAEFIDYLQSLLAKNPDSVGVLSVLAATYILDHRWADGEEKVRMATKIAPGDIGLKLKLIDIIEAQDVARAEASLKELVNNDPNDGRLVFRLVRYYQDRERYPEAEALLKKFIAHDPGSRNAINARLKLAELAWMKQDLLEAKTLVNQVLASEPRYVDALTFRAVLSMAEQAYPAVFVDLQQVLEIQPESEQALALMAKAYHRQGLVDSEEEVWRRVLQTHPGSMAGLRFMTERLIARGDWLQAVQYIDKAVEANPGNRQYLELRFQLALKQDDWASAKAEIIELRKWPQYEDLALRWQGLLAMRLGHYLQAVESYTAWLEKRPYNVEALTGLAQAYLKNGQSKELIAFLKSRIQKTPNFDEAYRLLARAYAMQKNWVAAEKVLQDKLSRTPSDVSSWGLLAEIYASQSKHLEAEKTFQAGHAATANNLELMASEALFYLSRREFDKAISVYEHILAEYPDNVMAINNLADLLVGRRDNKRDDMNRALVLVERFRNVEDPSLLDTFAWVQLQAGNVQTALPVLQRVAEESPQNPSIHYHLAEALSQIGDKSAARAQLEKLFAIEDKQGFMDLDAAQALRNQL